ncbi:MAG: BolA/IbaG family iron-sulfur metabolism protein [Vulcanimicrobiaceae bacterium]
MVALIRGTIPDAEVDVFDLTGTKDHFEVSIRSSAFRELSPLDRHRLVERAVAVARADGRIHAMSIRTELPE